MEKMKIGIVTVAALALVAVVVSVLVINSGIVLAVGPPVKQHVNAQLTLTQQGADVDVGVKAQGLASTANFQVRTYTVKNCGPSLLQSIGTAFSDSNGNLKISGTILTDVVDSVESVSIRSAGPAGANPPVVCFQDPTP